MLASPNLLLYHKLPIPFPHSICKLVHLLGPTPPPVRLSRNCLVLYMCRVMATDVVLIITGQQLGQLRGGEDVVQPVQDVTWAW